MRVRKFSKTAFQRIYAIFIYAFWSYVLLNFPIIWQIERNLVYALHDEAADTVPHDVRDLKLLDFSIDFQISVLISVSWTSFLLAVLAVK